MKMRPTKRATDNRGRKLFVPGSRWFRWLMERRCGAAKNLAMASPREKAGGRDAAGFRMRLSAPASDSTACELSIGPDG
jgi:hypothetical protein